MKKVFFNFLIGIGIIVFCKCQSEEQYAETILSTMEENDRTYQDISSDTLIFQVGGYFKKTGQIDKLALTTFYVARVYQSQKNYEKAFESYLKAQTYAEQGGNYNLVGTINFFLGNIYYEQLLFPEAKEKLILAQEFTHLHSDNYNREIVIFNIIGNCHLLKEESDSAIVYYNKALDLILIHNDSSQESITRKNLSTAFSERKDFENAKKYLKEAAILDKNDESSKYYLNRSKLFYEENQYDSVVYYTTAALKLAENENDISVQIPLKFLLSETEKKRGNYKKALEYYSQYTALLSIDLEKKKQQDLLIIENKYNYEQTQNKNNQLLIERQGIYSAFLLSFILIIATIFIYYRKAMNQKNRILRMEVVSLEAEQRIQALKNMAESFNEKEKSLRNEVLSHFKILRKVALLKEDKQFSDKTNYKNTPLEKINSIVYGDKKGLNWDQFFESMNTFHTDIVGKINHTYPSLDPLERKICYLTCMDFNNTELATLLEHALNTIEQKKTNIRKKLNIPDRGNIKDFLTQNRGFF